MTRVAPSPAGARPIDEVAPGARVETDTVGAAVKAPADRDPKTVKAVAVAPLPPTGTQPALAHASDDFIDGLTFAELKGWLTAEGVAYAVNTPKPVLQRIAKSAAGTARVQAA
jgi:hypothetical protein